LQKQNRKDEALPVFSSFDSIQTAACATRGRVFEVLGHESSDAIIVEDEEGRYLLYVRPEFHKYRQVADAAFGEKLSGKGRDADHVASRKIAGQLGQNYVLLGGVDLRANRSAGSKVEKPGKVVDQYFNNASLGPAYAEGNGSAVPISRRQLEKSAGRMHSEYGSVRRGDGAASIADPEVLLSLFQDDAAQRRIEGLRGREIVRASDLPPDRQASWGTTLEKPLALTDRRGKPARKYEVRAPNPMRPRIR
jgi:hypothetical protein